MEELSYKNIMTDVAAFEQWLTASNLKEHIRSVEKIDTAGTQIILGLLQQNKIAFADLSQAVQDELLFLGVSNG